MQHHFYVRKHIKRNWKAEILDVPTMYADQENIIIVDTVMAFFKPLRKQSKIMCNSWFKAFISSADQNHIEQKLFFSSTMFKVMSPNKIVSWE